MESSKFKINGKYLETIIVTFCYIAFTVLLLKEVIFRYAFASSSDYIEEVSRYLFVFLVYFAAAEAIKTRSHLGIDIILQFVSERKKLYLYLFYDICWCILAILIIVLSLQIMQVQQEMNMYAVSATLINAGVKMAYVYAAIPLGWGLILYRVIQRLIITVKALQGKTAAVEATGSEI